MKYTTNYKVAASWLHNSLILCNDIVEKDSSVYDKGIYQWFLTDCSEDDVEYLEEHFGLLFSYSDLLGLYILLR